MKRLVSRAASLGLAITLLTALVALTGCAAPTAAGPALQPSDGPPATQPPVSVAQSPVKIVVYSDFECGACQKFHSQVEPELRQIYVSSGRAELEARVLGVIGDGSIRAAEAALAARDQGRFAEFEDALFSAWLRDGSDAYSDEALTGLAASLGMDIAAFDRDMSSDATRADLDNNLRLAGEDGIHTLPAIIVSDSKIEGYHTVETYTQLIEDRLSAWETQGQDSPSAVSSTGQRAGAAPEAADVSTESPSQPIRDMTIDLLTAPTWAAQTFATPADGWVVTAAAVGVSRIGNPAAPLTVSVRATDADGHPLGPDLVAGAIPPSGVAPVRERRLSGVTLDRGYFLKGNTRYALVVYSSGQDRANYYSWWIERNDVFPGGNLEQSVDSGASWIAQPWDTNFELIIASAPTS